MADYVTPEQLTAAAERDVDCDGTLYRVRKLTMLEMAQIHKELPLLPTGEEKEGASEDPASAVKTWGTFYAIVSVGLLKPEPSEDVIQALPAQHVIKLANAIAELSGVARPFDQSPTESG